MYTSGKRQYLHKMQMLEMNRKRQEVNMRREWNNVTFTKATLRDYCPAHEYVKHSSPGLT